MLPGKIKNASLSLGDKSVIIIAHPDDEVLWFSSILEKVDDVVVVFNDYAPIAEFGLNRKNALKSHPCKSLIQLAIDESVSYEKANWPIPNLTPYGTQLANPKCDASHQKTFEEIITALSSYLTRARPTTVFTHNPWGEYGHEDHIQIYRALETLQASFGFQLRVSCYTHDASKALMKREIKKLSGPLFIGQTDELAYNKIRALYQENNVWTWQNEYTLPKKEFFFTVTPQCNPDNKTSLLDKIIAMLTAPIKRLYTIELNWPRTTTKRGLQERILRKLKQHTQKTLKIIA